MSHIIEVNVRHLKISCIRYNDNNNDNDNNYHDDDDRMLIMK